MKPNLHRVGYRAAAALCLMMCNVAVWAAGASVQVYPVRAFFYDSSEKTTLDPSFLSKVTTLTEAALSNRVHGAIRTAFVGKLAEKLDDKDTAGRTFVVSFHATRANSYIVNKGNGTSDLVVSLTASLYFTNVISGEVLTTFTKTAVGQAVVANSESVNAHKENLFAKQLDTLIGTLISEAAHDFNPTVVDVKVTDRVGKLLVLDAGYGKGLQVGDGLEDSARQLVSVIYVAQNYAIASPVLADNAGPGSVFQKIMAHPADGKVKPPVLVLAESVPQGFSKEYLAQLFSDQVGSQAPLTVVQVNPGFAQLLNKVREQTSLSANDTAKRRPPELFIRLRVAEPIAYEVSTNLDFKKIRHYETLAFADVVDSSGRVNFTVLGKDVIDDQITSNVGAGMAERREVSIQNALHDLAAKLGKLSEVRREASAVLTGSPDDVLVASEGKVFSPGQKGMVLRRTQVQLGGAKQSLWLPVVDAHTDELGGGIGKTRLNLKLYSDGIFGDKVVQGDVFEVERLGTTPRTAHKIQVCGPAESLGDKPITTTPSLMDLLSHALGSKMPAMVYSPPEFIRGINELVGDHKNFAGAVQWDLPKTTVLCIQPVERVAAGEAQCMDGKCEYPLTARYTLRVKAGNEVLTRVGFESQFKSTDFYKQGTSVTQIQRLIDADVIDVAQSLLEKAADQLKFVAP